MEHARYLASLAKTLGVDKVSLVGQSLGGAIAARATVDGLLDVQRLVLIGSAGWSDGAPRDERHTMRAALTDRSLETVRARLEHAMTCRGQEMDELVEARYRAYQLGDWQQRLDAFTYHETPQGRRETALSAGQWRAIACPVLLIWGDRDAVVPPEAGEALASLIPRSRLMMIPGAGHNPQFEQPDQVNPAMAEFLRGAEFGSED